MYQNQTFSNVILPVNRHALFKNCTFQNVLYIDASKTSTSKSYTNNVRFENCTFNGVIVTNTPQSFNWVNNCLYFTGAATFNNQSSIQEATILAPHFNVNLGNTNPQQSDNNVLTGAIVGGIVDVRGNAQIYGTIISMCDTSQWPSGYVTNIGATLERRRLRDHRGGRRRRHQHHARGGHDAAERHHESHHHQTQTHRRIPKVFSRSERS